MFLYWNIGEWIDSYDKINITLKTVDQRKQNWKINQQSKQKVTDEQTEAPKYKSQCLNEFTVWK